MGCAASTSSVTASTTPEFDLDQAWTLDEDVQIRPERFGGLLYHFGTRQLSFVKAPDLLAVLKLLGDTGSAREALDRANITDDRRPAIIKALRSLATSSMIRPSP